MAEKTVGVRELKAKLSAFLEQVKEGHTVIITERGRPVGRIIAAAESVDERVQTLVRCGAAAWSGKKIKPRRPAGKIKRRHKTLAEIVTENRD